LAGLRRRGDLTLWLDEDAVTGWQAPRRTTPGGEAWYSDAAIELVLMLRLVFHLALRQAEGFTMSVLRLRVPDHTTLSRRSPSFAGRQPKVIPDGSLHLVIGSTGLKLFGQGEWDAEKHGRTRRSWHKLHLTVDAGTGEIVACLLTDNAADDASQVPALLEAIETRSRPWRRTVCTAASRCTRPSPATSPIHRRTPSSRHMRRRCRARRTPRRRANATATSRLIAEKGRGAL
jgi:hypothetical protein